MKFFINLWSLLLGLFQPKAPLDPDLLRLQAEADVARARYEKVRLKLDLKDLTHQAILAEEELQAEMERGSRTIPVSQPQVPVSQPRQVWSYQPNQCGYPEITSEIKDLEPKQQIRFNQDPTNGYPAYLDDWFGVPDEVVPVNSFPRELYVDRPSTLRTQIAMDACRLQSRLWAETCGEYGGCINQLTAAIIGQGMTIGCTLESDEAAAEELEEYLEVCSEYESNDLPSKVITSTVNMFRDGESLIRVTADEVACKIRSVDTSTLRGAHYENTGPWAFGILTDWPRDWETVHAYHLWYSDNTHEDVSPADLAHLVLSTTHTAGVKRGVPLAYRIRKLIPQFEALSHAMASGEVVRQRTPYVVTHELESTSKVQNDINTRLMRSPGGLVPPLRWMNRDRLDESSGIHHWGPGKAMLQVPQSGDANPTFERLCCRAAAATCTPSWYWGSKTEEAFAGLLVPEALVLLQIRRYQADVANYWKRIFYMVRKKGVIHGHISPRTLEVDVQCDFPNPVPRNRKVEIEADSLLLETGVMAPQTLARSYNLNWDDEQELRDQAIAEGWVPPKSMDQSPAEPKTAAGEQQRAEGEKEETNNS